MVENPPSNQKQSTRPTHLENLESRLECDAFFLRILVQSFSKQVCIQFQFSGNFQIGEEVKDISKLYLTVTKFIVYVCVCFEFWRKKSNHWHWLILFSSSSQINKQYKLLLSFALINWQMRAKKTHWDWGKERERGSIHISIESAKWRRKKDYSWIKSCHSVRLFALTRALTERWDAAVMESLCLPFYKAFVAFITNACVLWNVHCVSSTCFAQCMNES